VVQANRGTLRELHTAGLTSVADLEVLLQAAPGLRTLSAGSRCGLERALPLLRNEPPYGPLRLHTLTVFGTQMTETRLSCHWPQRCRRTPRCAAWRSTMHAR
jgi:hypothetical protein